MARKKANERRAEVLAALEAAKRDVAELEAKDAARIGKLAVRAGLADLDIDDAAPDRADAGPGAEGRA